MRAVLQPRFLVIAAAVVVVALLPSTLSGYHQGLAARVAIYFIAILGLNILTGYTGQISIGHGAFMAIGGYTTAILSHDHHMNLLVTLPIAFAISFVFGVLVGLPALRLSGVYLALATFAFAVSVPQLALKFSKFAGGSNGIHADESFSHLKLYVVSWGCAGISFVLAWLLLRGRIGRAFRATRDSPVAAASSGVSLPIYKTFAFGVSAAYAGVAGSLFVIATNGLRPAAGVRGHPLPPAPDRRRRRRPRLPLGRPGGRGLRRPPAHRLGRCAADRLRARPGRRLRADRDPDHAPAPERRRGRPRPARPEPAGPILTLRSIPTI
jgi:ABC-type branched-chain amino acid transport system, permease component